VSTSLLQGYLFGVEPGDGATFSVICMLLFLSGLAAAYIPARSAAAVDPATALRHE